MNDVAGGDAFFVTVYPSGEYDIAECANHLYHKPIWASIGGASGVMNCVGTVCATRRSWHIMARLA